MNLQALRSLAQRLERLSSVLEPPQVVGLLFRPGTGLPEAREQVARAVDQRPRVVYIANLARLPLGLRDPHRPDHTLMEKS